ncbi:MAG TPA: NAD(P)-dependent oxidoreductase [Chitinophagaceae bacterium]|nr:NAD(P)-dependent oxidoreductase [Chitinophagaceae bacterium]
MLFTNKNVFITGGSRGIGKAIALRLAKEGASIAIAAKTTTPHPKLEGTIYTAAKELEAAGTGKILPLQLDVRDEEGIAAAVKAAADKLGGIDIVINNASAINLESIEKMDPKRFDLMQDINMRGTFFVSQACIPYLKAGNNPHILTLSPPLNINPVWFAKHTAYTISKYSMSMIVLGLSEEMKKYKIAANALWPATLIATAAVQNLPGGDALIQRSRTAEIVADAAYYILQRPSEACTGNFFIDEQVLQQEGITDLGKYAVDPHMSPMKDLFL